MVALEESIGMPSTAKLGGDMPFVNGPFTVTGITAVIPGTSRSRRVATTLPLPAGLSYPCTRIKSHFITLLRVKIAIALTYSYKRVLEETVTVNFRNV